MLDSLDVFVAPAVLIAEDEPMIAMLLEDLLEQLGESLAGIAPSCAEALHFIDQCALSLVVLDVNLQGGTSEAIVAAADARRIPVLVSSGANQSTLPSIFRDRPFLAKPWGIEEAERLLKGILKAPMED